MANEELKQITDLVFLEKLKLWHETTELLDTVKTREMALRLELFKSGFPEVAEAPSKEGTFRVLLPHGWKLEVVAKLNTKIDDVALPAVLKQLSELNVPTDGLVKYKPSIAIAAFKKLPAEAKKLMAAVITQSRGAPTVKMVPPPAPAPEPE